MNATNAKMIERTFQVALFNETREVKAAGWSFGENAPEPTRFHANRTIAIRYRTSRKLHYGSVEIETKPEEVERLTSKFGWRKGDGIAYRVSAHRNFGNFRSALIPLGWADKYPQEKFA